jgi:hypothetical protein
MTEPLTFVTWRWAPVRGYRSAFGPETVNTLRRMVSRHYRAPHRFCCVTDDRKGLHPEIEIIPDEKDFAAVPSPAGGTNPSCYRRLRAFRPDIGAVFGSRFVMMDLDLVITGDLQPLFDRPEDFIIWGDTNPNTFYNGSLVLMRAGARSKVWETFNPKTSPIASKAAGHFGSDQGWISHCLGPDEPKWSTEDGVYSFRKHLFGRRGGLPPNARVVVFHGRNDPWDPVIVRANPWIREHYK